MSRSRTRHHTRRRPKANPRGIFNAHPEGYGFVSTAEGEFFVAASARKGAFDGDLVEVSPIKGKARDHKDPRNATDRPRARVVQVLDRAHEKLVGRYEVAEPFGVVVPLDARIPYDLFTIRADFPDVPDGALVRARITQFPSRHTAAMGVIEEVLDVANGDEVIQSVIARHKLETVFSEGALAEAHGAQLDEAGALLAGYRDIRDRFVFTVDPTDAKDYDDALSLDFVSYKDVARCLGTSGAIHNGLQTHCDPALLNGERASCSGLWRLGVHIADVSHYVPWNSSIDLDARRRATSVYLVDRVIPMLPSALSDDLCSLRPGEDRRAMSVDIYLNSDGEMMAAEIYPSLICSNRRLAYAQVDEIFVEYKKAALAGVALSWRLVECARLAKQRRKIRRIQGALDFETVEAKVQLNDEGRPVDVVLRKKTEATQLVEQAMILANEVVATYFTQAKWPCIYRVHERPATDDLLGLIPVFEEFDWFNEGMAYRLASGDPHVIQDILDITHGTDEGELVTSLLLRAMTRAVYSPVNAGHYGLGLQNYCHFTSPIRRYPDLVVHRLLRAKLTRRPECFDQEVNSLPWISEHSSDMERVAADAERETQEIKLTELMSRHVGEVFGGMVSGVASWGIYVRLENTAEGLVPVRSLGNEYFALDSVAHQLIGQDTDRIFRLGQRVHVLLKSATVENGIEFRLA